MLALFHTVALMMMMPMMRQGASLTLAQRRGLIPKPEKLLSQEEWATVHSLARQRNECSAANCAICLEPFKAEQQVRVSVLRYAFLQAATVCTRCAYMVVGHPCGHTVRRLPPPSLGACSACGGCDIVAALWQKNMQRHPTPTCKAVMWVVPAGAAELQPCVSPAVPGQL
jgi:hypothetical protein